MRVLILEDDLNIRKNIEGIIRETLTTTNIDTFRHISTAQKAIEENVYDVISLDIHLPDGNGLDFAKEIRRSTLNSHTHLLMISADQQMETAFKAYDQSHCYKFLSKPYENSDLINVLKALKAQMEHSPPRNCFQHQNRNMSVKIPMNEILYFEVFYKVCHIHTFKDKITMTRYPLKDILSAVESESFIQIHRSFIVNTHHIRKISLEEQKWYCTLNHPNMRIPIGKKFLPEVRLLMKDSR